MKVLTRRDAALKNTAVTSRARRNSEKSVISRQNSVKTEKRVVALRALKSEAVSNAVSNTTTEKTKENVKPENTGKKRGRPFKNSPKTDNVTPTKPKTQQNGTSNHTANNKVPTKETRSSKGVKNEDDTGKTKTRGIIKVKREEQTPETCESDSDEKPVEKNNNETNGVLTKGPLSGGKKLSDKSKKNDRKYQCGICMKVFLGSNDLRKHLRIHR